MVRRATRLLRDDGLTYDRVVAWASAEDEIPVAWTEQVTANGIIVAPVIDRAVLKLRVASDRKTTLEATIDAGFIPMTATPLRPWESDAG
jgi:protein-L-isoaspartate O-methyltransferase